LKTRVLEPFLKSVAKTGRVSYGLRESIKSLRGAKLLVVSSSLAEEERKRIEALCSSSKVPIINFDGPSLSLGKISGVYYPVKVLAVKSAGEADLEKLLSLAEQKGSTQKI